MTAYIDLSRGEVVNISEELTSPDITEVAADSFYANVRLSDNNEILLNKLDWVYAPTPELQERYGLSPGDVESDGYALCSEDDTWIAYSVNADTWYEVYANDEWEREQSRKLFEDNFSEEKAYYITTISGYRNILMILQHEPAVG
jgi:hypothetical protein